MNRALITNVVFLQVLWFAAILGAATDRMLPAMVWFGVFFVCHTLFGFERRRDLALVLIAVPVGFALDSLWVQLHWLEFSHAVPSPAAAPYWIAVLWAGFALTVNHSLRWLHQRPVLAGAFAMVSGPLSYFAAARLGAVVINDPFSLFIAIALSWGILVPCLLLLARGMDKASAVGQPT